MNKYKEYLKHRSSEINNFDIIFAFNKGQLEEGIKKLGVSSKDELISVNYGGFIRKKDKDSYVAIISNLNKELQKYIEEDDVFVVQMFKTEMSNLEYGISYDDGEIISSCGISLDKFCADSRLQRLFGWASDEYLSDYNKMWDI